MAGLVLETNLQRHSTTAAQQAGDHPSNTAADPTDDFSLSSFNELVLAHQDAAFNFACYLLGDSDIAADITQKAFISAYLNYSSFHGPSFRGWLFKIIKNASVDEFRSANYRRNRSLEGMETEGEWRQFPLDEQSPETRLEQSEHEAAIHAALARLEEPFRTVIILVDTQEMDYEEAARVLQIPIGTVKSRLARARAKFRLEMEKTAGL